MTVGDLCDKIYGVICVFVGASTQNMILCIMRAPRIFPLFRGKIYALLRKPCKISLAVFFACVFTPVLQKSVGICFFMQKVWGKVWEHHRKE